jgi:hypothetical protein
MPSRALLQHSLFNPETFHAGFDRDKVLIVTMHGYSPSDTREQIAQFYSQLLDRVKQLPGVHSASYSSFTPISGREVGVKVVVEGHMLRPGEVANERSSVSRLNIFETTGIPLLPGREFSEAGVHPDSASTTSPPTCPPGAPCNSIPCPPSAMNSA